MELVSEWSPVNSLRGVKQALRIMCINMYVESLQRFQRLNK